MFERFKNLFRKPEPQETWQQTLVRLAKELAPHSGEAETLQGELVRCIGNLNDEAKRNGWMNWDEGDMESVAVLRRYLPDPDLFPVEVREEIHKALDAVRYAGEQGADEGRFAYDELTCLAQWVADWCVRRPELEYKHPEATWLDDDPFQQP